VRRSSNVSDKIHYREVGQYKYDYAAGMVLFPAGWIGIADSQTSRHEGRIVFAQFLVATRATTMRKMAWKASTPIKARCEICNGGFGLVRHRFASKQFCSQQCLEQYLTERKLQASKLKQRIDLSRSFKHE
jgi:hypothetical protein